MSKWCFGICAAIAFGAMFLHEILGTPLVIPPLMSSDLPDNVIWLHRCSWHAVGVAALSMAAMFAFAALQKGNKPMAFIATAMSLGFAFLGVGLAITGNPVLWQTPAPYIWTVIAVIGGAGLLFDES